MSILKYTLVRILLIAAFAGILYLVGMRSFLLAFTAILCGAMAGFIFFPRQGQQAAGEVESLVIRKSHPAKSKHGRQQPSDEDVEDDIVDGEEG